MSTNSPVVALLCVYNEEDIIEQVLDYLASQGVETYVIDDQSTDRTRAIVDRHIGRGVIGIETLTHSESDHEFQWTRILSRKEQLAATLDGTWFIHHDADEFRESPWPGTTLAEGIARVDRAGFNAIDFALLDFWPIDESFVPGTDVREAIPLFEPGRTWNARQVKCWKKTAAQVELVSNGGHDVQFAGRRLYPQRFILRHYPIRGTAHGRRKIFSERIPRFTDSERARGWHVQYDEVQPDGSLTRTAASLRKYDPAVIRAELATADLERIDAERSQLAAESDALHATTANVLARQYEAQRALDNALARLEALTDELHQSERQLEAHRAEQQHLLAEIQAIYQSASWRVTAPVRAVLAPLFMKPRRQR